MYSSVVTQLCIYFLLCEQVILSQYSFLQNQTALPNDKFDNLLREFFIELHDTYLQKLELRHITVVGASFSYIQQVQPLLENYPYIVCTDPRICSYSKQFSRGSFVVIFLDDLSEKTFGNNIKILSQCRKCRVLFVSDEMIRVEDILLIFTLALKQNVAYVEFAHIEKNVIQMYSSFVATNCTMQVRLLIVWRPGAGLERIDTRAFRLRDLNGCPVSVSSLTFTPKMIIKESKNGSLAIAGGREGNLLLALAEKLNFTISLRYPSLENQLKYSRKSAILNDVASGISEIGIGRLRPTSKRNHAIAFSLPYDEECVTWGVPRLMNWSNDIIWVEFSWEVWASVGLIFVMNCVISYVHEKVVSFKNDKETGPGFVMIFLDAVAIHLGNPVVYVSTSAGGRFMLIAYLYYAMVITTAYKTSLASILATDEGAPRIVKAEEIIKENLKVGGSTYDYYILKDQVAESRLTQKLFERFVINNNDSETWDQLMLDQDYAFLARRSSLSYARQQIIKAREHVTFNIFNNCVLAYHAVMAFQKKSFLRKPVDDLIQHLTESGILVHWDIHEFNTDKILKRRSTEKYFEKRAVYKFRTIFVLYSCCIALSVITFFIELIVQRIGLMKFRT